MYIRETGRNLQKRLVEHKAVIKRGDTQNGAAAHAWQQHHTEWIGKKLEPIDTGGGEHWRL